jgi:hypothetical protein
MNRNMGLISVNPALQGAQDAAQLQRSQLAGDLALMQIEELKRTRDTEHAVDAALRDYILNNGSLSQAPSGDVRTASGSPSPAGQQQPASLANVSVPATSPRAPGPQATMGRGDATGFQGMLASILPPQGDGTHTGHPNYQPIPGTMNAPQAAMQNLPGDMTVPQPKMVPLQNPPMPGMITTPPAARTMGLDRQRLARRLAQVEGGGAAAYELLREQEDLDTADANQARADHDKAVANFFASIDKGDVYSARYWADAAGMDISDEVYSDAEAMRVLSVAGKYKSFYGSDVEGFGRFLDDAFKRIAAGDPNAFQSAWSLNKPKRIAGQGRLLSPDNQLYQSLLQKHGGDAVAAYQEWKVATAKAGGTGGSGTTFQQRKEFAEKLYPNDLEAQAGFINGGRKPSRAELRKMAVDEMTKRYGSNPPRGETWNTERDALVREYETLVYDSTQPAPDGDSGLGTIDFANQGRIPTPDQNEAVYTMPDGTDVYTNDGVTWYDGEGNLVYGGSGN